MIKLHFNQINKNNIKLSQMKYNVFIVKSANKTLTYRVQCMLFNATFKNISDISWLSVLLVEETGVATENDKPVAHLPIWIGVWRLMPLSIIFQSYCAVSFIGDGNRSTRRKPPTCHTSTHGTIIYDNKYG